MTVKNMICIEFNQDGNCYTGSMKSNKQDLIFLKVL